MPPGAAVPVKQGALQQAVQNIQAQAQLGAPTFTENLGLGNVNITTTGRTSTSYLASNVAR